MTGGAVLTRGEIRRPSALAVGTVVWLASELMFFGGLFASYFTIRANTPEWPPAGIDLDAVVPGIATLVLVLSAGTMRLAARDLQRGHRVGARLWLLFTMVLGAAFVAGVAVDWAGVGFSGSTNAYGSLYYLVTGFGGLHALFGVLLMLGVVARIAGPGPDPGDATAGIVVTYYWYFVAVMGVVVYATIYLLR